MLELSIIIPHYNSLESLVYLLDTIPKKDNIQVIVVDDKSTKKVEEFDLLIDDIKYSHITFLKNTTDKKGAGVSRNIALKHALGDWILFSDADDYFIDGFYVIVSKYFNSSVDAVYFTPTSIYLDTGELSDRHLYFKSIIRNYLTEKNRKRELHIRYSIPNTISKMIKRELIKKNNITFDDILASNDVMFSAKVGNRMDDFIISDEVIYCITHNKGSLTTNISEYYFDMRFNTLLLKIKFIKDNLSTSDFNLLDDLVGQWILLKSTRYGIIKSFKVWKELRKHDIKIFKIKNINPFYVAHRLLNLANRYLKNKKYHVE